MKDFFCWPQEVEDPQSFKGIVAEWDRVLWQVDALLEGGTHKRYVLGFGNGGAFASQLATHGYFAASGYAIVNGGALEAPPKAPSKPLPMMLVTAHDDVEMAPKMKELHEGLAKTGWAHAYCGRAGAHQLSAEDVDAALRFFDRDTKGTLKPEGKSSSYACEGPTKAVAEK
jgi:predicted esterase